MISDEISEAVETLLDMVLAIPENERVGSVLFLSTYMMRHAATILESSNDPAAAHAYTVLTQDMENLMKAVRDAPLPAQPAQLRLVKG